MTATNAARQHARGRFGARLLGERGAAAVEFALVVPLLVLVLLGIVEFSRAFQVQATLAAAAREGARVMVLTNDETRATGAVRGAASSLDLGPGQITVAPDTCSGTDVTETITVTVRFTQPFVSGLLGGAGVDLTGKAVMRCGG